MSKETIDIQEKMSEAKVIEWFKTAKVEDFPEEGGAAVKYKDKQVAIFNFTSKGEWYATLNMCPA